MGTVANIKVQPMSVTWGGSALGFTKGDIKFELKEETVDITAHQEGKNVLGAIRVGKSATLSLELEETNTTLIKYILGQSGQAVTASGGSGSVIGWGSGRDFTSVLSQAGKLVLHPVANAASALSEDIAAWKAYPMPESISYSGENPSILNIAFKIFPDYTKASQARLLVIGNHSTGDFSVVT